MELQFRAALVHAKMGELARIQRISVLINVLVALAFSEQTVKPLLRAAPSPARMEDRVPIRPTSPLINVLVFQVSLESTVKLSP